jgi:cardiolipin synthase
VIRDADFAHHLGERLEYLIENHCKHIAPEPPPPRWAFWHPLRSFLLFHLLSGYSRWFSWLPHRAPTIQRAQPEQELAVSPPAATNDGAR